MLYKIEIKKRDNTDAERLKRDIKDLNINVKSISITQIWLISGDISGEDIKRIACEILADPIWETYTISQNIEVEPGSILVSYNPGVTDPVAESTLKIINELGIEAKEVKRIKKYIIEGVKKEERKIIEERLLYNKLIQHIVEETRRQGEKERRREGEKRVIDISDIDENLSSRLGLFLNKEEMEEIKNYFSLENREPTATELETIAILWSEHCSHKTMRGEITVNTHTIHNLLKSTVMRVTNELNKKWVISAFKDNAGIVEFNENYGICFKVETHNHPSALEPFGGAATGIGGVIRDILGCGLSAKPILNTDVFCFGNQNLPYKDLPSGILHPKRIMRGVVQGVSDYGNKMGIPTVNGAVFFDKDYIANPVVYCGCCGIIPKNRCKKRVWTSNLIVLIGGKTGRDGIHGATFSSGEMGKETQERFGTAVQIGDPITEKVMLDGLMVARDKGLYSSITDCGAGGISCAVSELAEGMGAEVWLEKVPLKYEGLTPREIWISESQERMVLSVPAQNFSKLKKVFGDYGGNCTAIGKFTNTNRIIVKYNEAIVCNLSTDFVLKGMPKVRRKANIKKLKVKSEKLKVKGDDPVSILKKILLSPNIRQKEWVVHQYDHEVQGGSVIKPLYGDAAVIRPLLRKKKGIVIGNGINPMYAKDPYNMASSAVDEAIRNVVSVGGDPERIALLDNYTWGSPEDEKKLGDLVLASYGLYDTAIQYETPFISGKDSLYNEYKYGDITLSVPPTLLISAITTIENVKNSITPDLKKPGDSLYLIGKTFDELGGSHLCKVMGIDGGKVPKVNPKTGKFIIKRLHQAILNGYVASCHDLSEGGLLIALCEMCISGGIGAEIKLENIILGEKIENDLNILFSESNTRFLVETRIGKEGDFEKIMQGVDFSKIGRVTQSSIIKVKNLFRVSIKELL
jgi:phosphoribosylformylglycinamidine synthase